MELRTVLLPGHFLLAQLEELLNKGDNYWPWDCKLLGQITIQDPDNNLNIHIYLSLPTGRDPVLNSSLTSIYHLTFHLWKSRNFAKMSKTALMVMDVQLGFATRMPLPPNYLSSLAKTIKEARPFVKVIYCTVAFRPGHPEIVLSNLAFATAAQTNKFVTGSQETTIHPAVTPEEGDILVEKKRVSAFTGSGLDVILRGLGVEKLVLTGMSTSGVVLSTLCDAADRDFGIVVLNDLCVDPDEALHDVLIEKVFKKRGNVLESEKWLETLKA